MRFRTTTARSSWPIQQKWSQVFGPMLQIMNKWVGPVPDVFNHEYVTQTVWLYDDRFILSFRKPTTVSFRVIGLQDQSEGVVFSALTVNHSDIYLHKQSWRQSSYQSLYWDYPHVSQTILLTARSLACCKLRNMMSTFDGIMHHWFRWLISGGSFWLNDHATPKKCVQ